VVRITIDEALKRQIMAATEEIELCDPDGNVVGRIPVPGKDFPAGWEPMAPPISDEELQRRLQYDGPGYTTEEVIAHLKSRS